MFDIGFFELIIIAIIALLVLGPERLPAAASAAGAWVGKAKRTMTQLSQQLDQEMAEKELQQELLKQLDDTPSDQEKS